MELAGRYRLEEPIGAGGMGDVWRGTDLRTILARQPGGLAIPFVVSVVAQVADALAAAHSRGVVHRDIKPANLFVQGDGRVKICDFGIVRLGDATTRLTSTGGFIGTPLYMSPEQFQGQDLDARADLYSLGCVLHELLVGAPPFNGDTNPAAMMYQHMNQVPAPPRSRRPGVPEYLDRLTMDLLAKDPARRPPNAAVVAGALRGPGGVVAPPADVTVPSNRARPGKRRLIPYLAAAVAVDARPHPPKLHVVRDDSVTARGVVAAREILAVTTTGRTDACTPPRAVVETIAMAATRDASTLGPLIFVVFADRGVHGQFSDADIDKIGHSVRPFHCPPGKSTHHGDNKCS